MSRFLKIVGYVVGAVVALVLVAAVSVYFASNARLAKTFAITPRPVTIPTDAVALARGDHLAHTRGCSECHGKDFGGNKVIDNGAMGLICAPNLTRGKGGRTATFTDADWVRAIRHGVAPDGRAFFLMPSQEYSHFSDSDLGAIIAYLKTVPAVDRERVPFSFGPISRLLLATGKMKLPAEMVDHAHLQPLAVTPAVTVEYGRYVANGCIGCHGVNFSGGKIDIGPPDWPQAADLTPHPDGHLAKWTEADFLQTLRTMKRPDGTELNPVMPRVFGQMDDTELKALWLFFKSLPPVAKGVR